MANRKPKVKKPDWADKKAGAVLKHIVEDRWSDRKFGFMIARALRAAYRKGYNAGMAEGVKWEGSDA